MTKTITISDEVESTHLRTIITGWGMQHLLILMVEDVQNGV